MKKYPPLVSILEAYKERNAEMREMRKRRQGQGIIRLEVAGPDKDFLISVDLDDASFPVVIRRLLDRTKTPYLFDNVVLRGKITTRFDDVPLMRALDLLLDTRGLTALLQDEIVIIKDSPALKFSKSDADSDTPAPSIYREVPLKYLDMETASNLLDGIYPDGNDGRLVNYGTQPNTNTVFLFGPADEVEKAARLLGKADRDPLHVIIECLVVEFDVEALEQLGADISDAASRGWSEVASNIGAPITSSARTITFTRTAHAEFNSVYTAMIDVLISENKARIVARPYISALSGKTATINITRDRHVVVQQVESGAAITTTEPITSGVKLVISPTVLSDNMVRMVVSVEDSHFIATSGNVVVEVDTDSAETTMQVESGQAIIIGGLTKNKETWQNDGIPWLRHIPIVNWIASKLKRTLSEQEIIIYVTPHIWSPGMTTPLVEQGALEINEDSNPSLFEKLGIRKEN